MLWIYDLRITFVFTLILSLASLFLKKKNDMPKAQTILHKANKGLTQTTYYYFATSLYAIPLCSFYYKVKNER